MLFFDYLFFVFTGTLANSFLNLFASIVQIPAQLIGTVISNALDSLLTGITTT